MLKIFKKFKKKTDHRTLYQILGEETGTYELVRSFYTHMENDPKATGASRQEHHPVQPTRAAVTTPATVGRR